MKPAKCYDILAGFYFYAATFENSGVMFRAELIASHNVLVWCLKKVVPPFAVGETHHDINIDSRTPLGPTSNGNFAHR